MKKKVNKILHDSNNLINRYNAIFRNTLKDPNIKAMTYRPLARHIKILPLVKKYDWRINKYYSHDSPAFDIIKPSTKNYTSIIYAVEIAATFNENYIPTPYCIFNLMYNKYYLSPIFSALFCKLPNRNKRL